MAESSDDGWEDEKVKQEFDEIFGPAKQEVRPQPVVGEEARDPLRNIKIKISSLLVGEQELLHTREIALKFYETYEKEINPMEYGDFVDMDDLLLAMPDKIECFERDGLYLYRAKNTDRVADILGLVARQMTKEDIQAKRMQKRCGWGANRDPPLPVATRISHIDVVDEKQSVIQQQLLAQQFSSAQTVDFPSVRAILRANREEDKEILNRTTDWDAPLPQRTSLQPGSVEKGQNLELPVNSAELLNTYFSEFGKEVSLKLLPIEMVQIVFQYPRSFSINTRPGSGEDSTLVSMVKPLSIKTDTRALKVKSATETNLAWIGHAPFILEVCKFTKVSILYMMSKKSLLVSTFWGNEKSVRFLLLNQYICNLNAKSHLRNVSVLIPGQMYVIKSGKEFARGVLLSETTTPGKYLFACVDFNATSEIFKDDIFDLPVALSLNKLPGNIFLARLRGIENIKDEHVAHFKSRMVQSDVWKKPVATCVIYDFMSVKNGIHVACIDMIVPYKGGHDWLSKVLINEGMAIEKPGDPQPIEKLVAHGTVLAMEKAGAFSMRDSDIWSMAKPPKAFRNWAQISGMFLLFKLSSRDQGYGKIVDMICQPPIRLPSPKIRPEVAPKKADYSLEEGEIRDESVSSVCTLAPTPLLKIKSDEDRTTDPTDTTAIKPSKADQVKYSKMLRDIAQHTLLCIPRESSDHELLVHKILDFISTLQLVLPMNEIDKEDVDSLVADLYGCL